LLAVATAAPAHAQATADPRVGLPGGHWAEAGSAIRNLEQIGHVARPAGFFNAAVGGRRWLLGS
jgi:hypothetical protein